MAFSALRSWGTGWTTGGASEGGRLWERGDSLGRAGGWSVETAEQEPESWGQWDLTEEEGGSAALAPGTGK